MGGANTSFLRKDIFMSKNVSSVNSGSDVNAQQQAQVQVDERKQRRLLAIIENLRGIVSPEPKLVDDEVRSMCDRIRKRQRIITSAKDASDVEAQLVVEVHRPLSGETDDDALIHAALTILRNSIADQARRAGIKQRNPVSVAAQAASGIDRAFRTMLPTEDDVSSPKKQRLRRRMQRKVDNQEPVTLAEVLDSGFPVYRMVMLIEMLVIANVHWIIISEFVAEVLGINIFVSDVAFIILKGFGCPCLLKHVHCCELTLDIWKEHDGFCCNRKELGKSHGEQPCAMQERIKRYQRLLASSIVTDAAKRTARVASSAVIVPPK
jgi:hypothetical protein